MMLTNEVLPLLTKEAICLQRDIEARSRNTVAMEKCVCVCVCVCVVLVIQHAKRMRSVILCAASLA